MNVVPFARGQPASDYSECGGKTQVLRQRSSLQRAIEVCVFRSVSTN